VPLSRLHAVVRPSATVTAQVSIRPQERRCVESVGHRPLRFNPLHSRANLDADCCLEVGGRQREIVQALSCRIGGGIGDRGGRGPPPSLPSAQEWQARGLLPTSGRCRSLDRAWCWSNRSCRTASVSAVRQRRPGHPARCGRCYSRREQRDLRLFAPAPDLSALVGSHRLAPSPASTRRPRLRRRARPTLRLYLPRSPSDGSSGHASHLFTSRGSPRQQCARAMVIVECRAYRWRGALSEFVGKEILVGPISRRLPRTRCARRVHPSANRASTSARSLADDDAEIGPRQRAKTQDLGHGFHKCSGFGGDLGIPGGSSAALVTMAAAASAATATIPAAIAAAANAR
jgi:hypothetical protein